MTFPRHKVYKNSGVGWLGEVPQHWETWKLSHAFGSIGSGTTPPTSEPGWYEDGVMPWITTGELRENVIYATTKMVSAGALKTFTALRVHPAGSLAIAMYGATIGRLGILGVEATTNQACCVLSDPLHITTNFLFYWFSVYKIPIIDLYATGGGQPNINQELISGLRVPAPGIEEQFSIVAFLDRETVKIDALITEQERLIALLKEKRQAVISHAVTKGLDPDVPMEDSGIEWLGEVPEHWEVKRIKYVVRSIEQGWSPQCEGFPVSSNDEWGILKVGCVNGGTFNPSENKVLPTALKPIPGLGISTRDLLISRANTRELVGSAAVAHSDYPNLMLCDKLYRLRVDPAVCFPDFLASYLGTEKARGQIELSATGASSSMLNIGQATILELVAPCPPVSEQVEIVAFLERHMAKFNALAAEAQHAIDLLKQRRSTLISAAVTGKIDVRGLVEEVPPSAELEPV